MIIRGGYNIAATEVEAVLYEHPAVHEAAVVGVDHAVLGQAVGAFVALRPGAAAEACELRDFCAERLADYKVPQGIWFVGALPRNAVGKVLKRDLRPPARWRGAPARRLRWPGTGRGRQVSYVFATASRTTSFPLRVASH